jgi:integrase
MAPRRQLPQQIRKLTIADRRTGKPVVRYQLTVEAGHDPESGKRRQLRRRFATEAAARAALADMQAGVRAGTYIHASRLTVQEAVEGWLASKHSLKPSTLRGHRQKLSALCDELGHLELQRLSKAHIDGLIGRLRSGEVEGRKAWTPRSCNYLRYLIGAVLDDQMKQGTVVRNVGKMVDRVAGEPQQFRTLTFPEMAKILAHECREQHLWALALAGLRRGEIAGLRWVNVNTADCQVGDLPARSIRITENRVEVGKRIEVGSPKSKASRRVLPLPDDLATLLSAARARQLADLSQEGLRPGEYVAADAAGQPYRPSVLTWRWGAMLDGLGIERVRLHDARHSCATLMHLQGTPIAVISAWLGHSNAAFTMTTYAHSQDPALSAAADRYQATVTRAAAADSSISGVTIGDTERGQSRGDS